MSHQHSRETTATALPPAVHTQRLMTKLFATHALPMKSPQRLLHIAAFLHCPAIATFQVARTCP
jgi:hypothetical protein